MTGRPADNLLGHIAARAIVLADKAYDYRERNLIERFFSKLKSRVLISAARPSARQSFVDKNVTELVEPNRQLSRLFVRREHSPISRRRQTGDLNPTSARGCRPDSS